MEHTIEIHWPDGSQQSLSRLWLRDNCRCPECRIAQTEEKQFQLASLEDSDYEATILADDKALHITWANGHQSQFEREFIDRGHQIPKIDWKPWEQDFEPKRFDFNAFLNDDQTASGAIESFLVDGVLILTNSPTEPNTLEQLAPRLGPIREVLFERIHNVKVDPKGYNVAHTSLGLPPHNDFASYTWPPSVQALHMLVNESTGGHSTVLDGWGLLEDFRAAEPTAFEVLCRVEVPFREFDADNETFTCAPMIQLDSQGMLKVFRYSNQLMQTLDPTARDTIEFYNAYYKLSKRVLNSNFQRSFRLDGGQILIVASHRILHGRKEITSAGARHLQDAYFEHDNVRNMLSVLERRHA